MSSYIIIELADGLEPVELPPDQVPEDFAVAEGGVLVDAGPFASLEEASDAIDNLKAEAEDEKV